MHKTFIISLTRFYWLLKQYIYRVIPISQSVKQSVSQSLSQSVSGSVRQPINRSCHPRFVLWRGKKNFMKCDIPKRIKNPIGFVDLLIIYRHMFVFTNSETFSYPPNRLQVKSRGWKVLYQQDTYRLHNDSGGLLERLNRLRGISRLCT